MAMNLEESSRMYNLDKDNIRLRKQLQQERERTEKYRMTIADAYRQLPEIPNAHGCPVCRRFIWTIKDHKSSCLYKILDDALSK